MKQKIIILLSVLCLIISLTGCSVVEKVKGFTNKPPAEEELLANIPKIDQTTFNRFLFDMNITVGNTSGEGDEFTMSGAVETYKNISHMYNLDIAFVNSKYQGNAESWAKFDTNERYMNLGDGWTIGDIKNEHPIDDLIAAINERNTDMLLTMDDKVCTLSWTFSTDSNYLFGEFMDPYISDTNITGSGRITAVFNPETHEFEHFTFVISASNPEQAGALLDAVFYWDSVNDDTQALEIPLDVSNSAYKAATGVSTDGGYDPIVNPMAEDFIEVYGGTAEINHYGNDAVMFWTLEGEISATVNYMAGDDAQAMFEEHYEFLKSFYGSTIEETDDGAYFYDEHIGELTYIGRVDNCYGEIIITGSPETSQGELRKPLITYKSRLGV